MSRFVVEHHLPRCEGGRMLGTRVAAAALTARHPDQISRHAQAVACDVATHLALYDLDEAGAAVARLRRRVV